MGFEPMASSLPRRCSAPELHQQCGAGNETRTRNPQLGRLMLYQLSYSRKEWWGRVDLNHRMLSRRVYSPFPLTTRAHPQEILNSKRSDSRTYIPRFPDGADDGNRTHNLRFTKPLLCQLSYVSLSGYPDGFRIKPRVYIEEQAKCQGFSKYRSYSSENCGFRVIS